MVKKILFWEDAWNSFESLQSKFFRLYRISKWKLKSIEEVYSFWIEHNTLDSSWERALRSWESEQAKEIENILKEIKLNPSEDKVIWKINMEAYSTKSCIEMLESSDPQFSGVWNTIWKIRLPHKIQLFLWKLEAGALPTNESLHVRLGEEFSKECPRCRGVIESSNHIVWNSLEAKSIWNMVANWWALNTMQRSKLGNSLKDTLSILKKKSSLQSPSWKEKSSLQSENQAMQPLYGLFG